MTGGRHEELERLRLVASAMAGRSVALDLAEEDAPGYTDGRIVYVPACADRAELLAFVAVQGALLAAGSLEPVLMKRMTWLGDGRPPLPGGRGVAGPGRDGRTAAVATDRRSGPRSRLPVVLPGAVSGARSRTLPPGRSAAGLRSDPARADPRGGRGLCEVFTKLNLSLDGSGAWLLPRLVGLKKAKELAFFADKIPAREAQRLGLVNCVLPTAELEAQVKEWASRLTAGPATALSLTKAMLNDAYALSFEQAIEEEARSQTIKQRPRPCGHPRRPGHGRVATRVRPCRGQALALRAERRERVGLAGSRTSAAITNSRM